jgi:hypothetical protein
MILVTELIQKRDKLLKATLFEALIKQDIYNEQVKAALEKGFDEAQSQWKADLAKYHTEIAKALEKLQL